MKCWLIFTLNRRLGFISGSTEILIDRNFGAKELISKSTSRSHSRISTLILATEISDNKLMKQNCGAEEAGRFHWREQSPVKWIKFSLAVSVVLWIVNKVWISPSGFQMGEKYKAHLEKLSGGDTTVTIACMLGIFAICHSGLASLRPLAETMVSPRVFRYIFALVSLPLAFSALVYFINHRNDGVQLWNIKDIPGVKPSVFFVSLLSFLFLYPSTFNLLEVAAVDEPTLHLWSTGIMRITRHPQFVGQLLWCIAHTAYVGTSFMVVASLMLCAHHMFAVWNGDRRIKSKFGQKADIFLNQTSIIPFAAILSGRQRLPTNYPLEFFNVPYITIMVMVFGSYFAHNTMIESSESLK